MLNKNNLSTISHLKVLLLLDNRHGHRSQCIGVAEALGLPFQVMELDYNFISSLPNYLLGASFIGIKRPKVKFLTGPFPDIIISAGRRTAPVAQKLKKISNNFTKLVQIMVPTSTNLKLFDLIAVPSHDLVNESVKIVKIQGAPHRLFPQMQGSLQKKWLPYLSDIPTPRIALLVGGSTKNRIFSLKMANELADLSSNIARNTGGSLLIATSPRTGIVAEYFINKITAPAKTFKWGNPGENPYQGFLALADAIIVTGDSMSMCSEACFSKKPVYIYAPRKLITQKHKRLHDELFSLGLAKPFSRSTIYSKKSFLNWTHPPLNSAIKVASAIHKLVTEGK